MHFLPFTSSSTLPLFLFFLLSNMHFMSATPINVTVDDQSPDPVSGQTVVYQPSAAWQGGQNCSSCTAKPPDGKTKAFDGTWMDASFFPTGSGTEFSGQIVSATFPFIGTAVYVQTILTGSSNSPDGNSDFTFLIDDTEISTFEQAPNNDTSYQYNQTIFSHSGMDNQLHTLRIEIGNSGKKALVMLDSIVYTQDNGTAASNTNGPPGPGGQPHGGAPPNLAIIIGPVVGGLAALAAAIIFFFVMRKRRRSHGVRVSIDSPAVDIVDLGDRSHERSPSGAGALNVTPFIINDRHSRASSLRTPSTLGPSSDYGTSVSSGPPGSDRYERFSRMYELSEAHWSQVDGTYTSERETDAGSVMHADLALRQGPLPPAYTDILPEPRDSREYQESERGAPSEDAASTTHLTRTRKC